MSGLSDEERIARLTGRKVTVSTKYRGIRMEQEHRVKSVRRFLHPNGEGREDLLVQFYAVHGGLRTVAVKDIIDVS